MIEKGVSHIAYFRTDGGSLKLYTQEYVDEKDKEIERLNNKLSLIKEIIRTPRALDSSLAYAMIKTQIENILGSDKE